MLPSSKSSAYFWHPPSWAVMGIIILSVLLFDLALPAISALVMLVLVEGFYAWLRSNSSSKKNISQDMSLSSEAPLKKKFAFSLPRPGLSHRPSVVIAVLLALTVLLGGLFAGLSSISAIVDNQALSAVMSTSTEALVILRESLPHQVASLIPASSYSLLQQLQDWVASNASALAGLGKKFLVGFAHVIIGAFIGVLLALRRIEGANAENDIKAPYLLKLRTHAHRFVSRFRRVFFAQAYISLSNTFFTGLFLGAVLPFFNINIPFVGVLIFITFLMGFIPIIGNIVSNTVITLMALSVSPVAAFAALAFLVVIHKLEYFLNAWIVGTSIKVRSYELLMAMLLCEAVFGLWGLVLAPVLYSYVKEEFLSSQENPPVA